MLRVRRPISGGAGNGPLLGALQPPQPSMGPKHHLCFSQRLLQPLQGKGLIIKKIQMGQPPATDLVKTELSGLLHFSGAAKLLQDRRDVHCMLSCMTVGKPPNPVCRDAGDSEGLFPPSGVSDCGQSSWEGEEDGSATDLDAGAWLCHRGRCQELGLAFWKEGLKVQNLN